MDWRVALPKFAPREPHRLPHNDTTTTHTFTMKQLFALFAVALLFAAPVSAQEGDTIFQSGDSMIVMVPDSAMADSAMADSAAAPAAAEMAEEAAPAAPAEDTVEVTGARQQIKLRIIEGGVLFMSFVVLCLIFGLALAVERIIYLNMATTNTKKLLTDVEDAMNSGGLDAAKAVCADTRGPVAAIFHQGLDRSGGSYEELAKAVEDYGSLESTKLERGLSWISLFIALAPMLGFMGTVIGMIEAFDKAGNVPEGAYQYYRKITPLVYDQGAFGWRTPFKWILTRWRGLSKPYPREPIGKWGMRIWAHKSTALACAHFMLAMRAHGFDTCPMEGLDSTRVKRILGLPDPK